MNTQQQAVPSRHVIRRDAAPSIDQVQQILSSIGTDTKESYVRTLVSLIATTGIRRRELCEARWSDVDFDGRAIRVHSKGRERKVPFGPKVQDLLQLQHDQDPGSQYLLGSNPDGVISRLSKTSLRYSDLRHFFLSQWVNLGGNLGALMIMAGYSCPSQWLRFMGTPEHAFKIAALHQAKIENELFKSADSDQSEVSA
jgi:integrase